MPAVSPGLMFYASDMIADKRYRCMTLSERGLLISMYAECWVNDSVPSNPEELCKILGYSIDEVEKSLTERIQAYFIKINDDLRAIAVDKYRQEVLANREKKVKSGRAGGRKTQQQVREMNNNIDSSNASKNAKAPRVEMRGDEKSQKQSIDNNIITSFNADYEAGERAFSNEYMNRRS